PVRINACGKGARDSKYSWGARIWIRVKVIRAQKGAPLTGGTVRADNTRSGRAASPGVESGRHHSACACEYMGRSGRAGPAPNCLRPGSGGQLDERPGKSLRIVADQRTRAQQIPPDRPASQGPQALFVHRDRSRALPDIRLQPVGRDGGAVQENVVDLDPGRM